MNPQWRIELFGGLTLCQEEERITHFATRKTASLLAYLSFYRHKSHLREALIELIWPESELDAGRNRLSTLLSYLRHMLEPPGTEAGTVVQADRTSVRLNPDIVTTDVADFEHLLQRVARTETGPKRLDLLEHAVSLYRGELLPGSYESWIGNEQARLCERFTEALQELGLAYEQAGESERALATIERALQSDPYREVTYRTRMRLLAGLGRPEAVRETYHALERLFRKELGTSPSRATRELAERLQCDPQAAVREQETTPRLVPPASPAPKLERPVPNTDTLSTEMMPTLLPLQMTRFFGRTQELAALQQLVRDPETRLVTVTGSGGAGKTRLAVEVAGRLAPSLQNRVWYVPLADIPDANLLPYALSRALKVAVTDTAEPLEAVLTLLKDAPCLLVLDNFEHLLREVIPTSKGDRIGLDTGTALIRLLLERAPALCCLITSQRPLHLSGEQEFPLLPLPLPVISAQPEAVLSSASVSLYVDWAKLARPDFALTAHNAEAVARLCRKLEGVPLAIEMAAAWAKVLPPVKMLERLGERLDLLTGRRRDLPARHLSLRATLDWSYELLDAPQQRLLGRLSVFRGGWALEAAEVICRDEDEPLQEERKHRNTPEVLDLLTDLVDKSLVIYEETEGEGRYRLLETVRHYSQDRRKLSDEATVIQARHFAFFRDMAEASWDQIRTGEQIACLDRLERDHENLRSALAWAVTAEGRQHAGLEAELDLAGRLRPFWDMRGYWREGRQRLEAALGRENQTLPTEIRATALIGAGVLAANMSDYATARAHYEACLTLRRQLGDTRGIGSVMLGLGNLASDEGDYAAAHRWFDEILAVAQTLEDPWFVALVFNNLGVLASRENDYAAEQHCHEESLRIRRQTGDLLGIAITQQNLSRVFARQENFPAAYAALEESLTLLQQVGDKRVIVHALAHMASMEMQKARHLQAARLFGATQQLMEEIGVCPDEEFFTYLQETQHALGDDAFHSAMTQGQMIGVRQALEDAMAILQEARGTTDCDH